MSLFRQARVHADVWLVVCHKWLQKKVMNKGLDTSWDRSPGYRDKGLNHSNNNNGNNNNNNGNNNIHDMHPDQLWHPGYLHRSLGFNAPQLMAAGFSSRALRTQANISAKDMVGLINTQSFPPVGVMDVIRAGYSVTTHPINTHYHHTINTPCCFIVNLPT